MTTSTGPDVVACPFCGTSASIRSDGTDSDYCRKIVHGVPEYVTIPLPFWVDCNGCSASVSGFESAADASEWWNQSATRRVMEAGEARKVAKLVPASIRGDVAWLGSDSGPDEYTADQLEAIATLLRAAQEEG